MQFVLSIHATKRLQKRNVPLEWVRLTIAEPDSTQPDPEDPQLTHARKQFPEKGFKTLRVIYNETTDPYTVVTVFFE